uniref:non-specific serine/threonine protein kinase n=1 Tax=Coccidioides posadasii RMSCC 3488 TaxID=454284 RepID=A0A0J6FAJ8_COCPO|nr:LOW QUALITY PROTEIN: SR protein-specific kinase Dsk1 [Coccidioides posadasii RMSCC 3488]
MTSLLRWAKATFRRVPSLPLCFPTSGFETVSGSELDEERFEEFKKGQYYPINIGDVLSSRYEIIGKLGFGVTSTVWLARDLDSLYAVKVYTRDKANQEEFQIYKYLNQGNPSHPGYAHVRKALDVFTIPRPGGGHHEPMWESFKDLLYRNPNHRFTEDLLRVGLIQVLLALDYLHTECKLVHTDIKGDNILQETEDRAILESFTKAEMENPSPRKFINGIPVYASQWFELPKTFGQVVLSDFGSAVRGDERRNHDAQPNVYRSPEVMLKAECWRHGIFLLYILPLHHAPLRLLMSGENQVWDLFEGKHMFHGNDPDGKGYSTRAHLAEVIGILGPPPLDMLKRGKRSLEFFTEDGRWKPDIEIPQASLEASEEFLRGRNKEIFLVFMRGMLQWRPEDRKTAKELLEDPWLNDQID